MSKRGRHLVFLLLAALVAPLVLGAGAAPAIRNVPSTVTITSGRGDQFNGKVKARKHCRIGRKVRLYLASYPKGLHRATVVGIAKTDFDGTWSMDGTFYSGGYYAKVTAKVIRIRGVGTRCAADESPTRRY